MNGVQSPNPPNKEHAFPITHSINCPIVIRDGIAWGFMIKSGRNPSFVNGISDSGIISPPVPFCPARDAILSPWFGIRTSRIRTFAIRSPASPSVMNVLSTIPNCPFLGVFDASTIRPSEFIDIPIKIVLSFTSVPSRINPYLSNLL